MHNKKLNNKSLTNTLEIKCYSCAKAMFDESGSPIFCRKLKRRLSNGYVMVNLSSKCGENSKEILNLGCGDSFYGTHRVDMKKNKSTTHVCNLERGIPFPDNSFDIVFERNLFEHLRNPGFHLDEIYRVLKLKGKLILITDYAGCLRYYIFGTHEGRYEKLRKSSKDKHYSVFTRQHMINHLTSAGFEIFWVEFVDTERKTRFLDKIMRVKPRIKVTAIKQGV